MPGVNDSVPTTINPGLLSASNLVNPNAPPTITPSAIQAMTDSIRSGALTAEDILDRTSELGKVHRKAQIELHKRQISDLQDPDLVAARHAQEIALGQVATTQGAQAQAQLPNVPLGAQTQAAQLKAALWDAQLHGAGLGPMQDVLMKAGWAVPTPAGGPSSANPDQSTQQEIVRRYQSVLQHQQEMAHAQDFLTKTDKTDMLPVKQTDAQGNEITIQKPTITYGGRTYDPSTRDEVQKFLTDPRNLMPGTWDAAGRPSSPSKGAIVEPSMVSPTAAANPSKPMVDASPGQQLPGGGIVTEVKKNLQDSPEKVLKDVQAKDSYKEWDKSLGYADIINQRNQDAQHAQQSGDPKVQNEKDIALTEAVIKLYDPQGVMRSFKWDKTTETRPIFEYISELKPLLLKNEVLTTPQRARLMTMANDLIGARERIVKPDLQRIQDVETQWGRPVLNERERSIANGTASMAAATPAPTAATGTTAAPRVMTRGNGSMVSSDGGKTWNWAQ